MGFVPPLRRAITARLHECGDRLKELADEKMEVGVYVIDADAGVIKCRYTQEVVECEQIAAGEDFVLAKNWCFNAELEFPAKGEYMKLHCCSRSSCRS
eukprot:1479103-Amphidinium_carterae.1